MAITFKGQKPPKKTTGLKGGTDYSDHLGGEPDTYKVVPAKVKVTKEKLHMGKPVGEMEQSEEVLNEGVIIAPDRLCHVAVSGTHTVNLGNYESAKIHVGLTMPADKDDINEAYTFAVDWVSERIEAAIGDAKN